MPFQGINSMPFHAIPCHSRAFHGMPGHGMACDETHDSLLAAGHCHDLVWVDPPLRDRWGGALTKALTNPIGVAHPLSNLDRAHAWLRPNHRRALIVPLEQRCGRSKAKQDRPTRQAVKLLYQRTARCVLPHY